MALDFTKLAVLWRGRSKRRPSPPFSAGSVAQPIVGHDTRRQPVAWPLPSARQASHILCLAASGAGKTVMISSGLLQEITHEKDDAPDTVSTARPALVLVDPKGDLVETFMAGLAATAPQKLQDLIYLDPFSKTGYPFNLNQLHLGGTPLDIRSLQLASLVAEVSTAVGSQKHLGVGARQLDILQHVLLGALSIDHPRASILLSLDALLHKQGFKALASVSTSERAKQFLLATQISDELRSSCSSRLRTALASTDSLERQISAEGCLQFSDILAPGKICLVNLGRPPGGLSTLQTFYANLLCRLAIEHLMERPSPWRGHHCRIVIDEAQIVAPVLSDRAEAILTTGRSRGISLIAISQGTTLIHKASDTLLRVLFTNTPTKFIGRLSAPDAELLAREQAPGAGVEESISTVRSRMVSAVTNLQDREFFYLSPGVRQRFTTADVDLAAWDQAVEKKAELINAAKERLALPSSPQPRLKLSELAPEAFRSSRKRRGRGRSKTAPRSRQAQPQKQVGRPSPEKSKGKTRPHSRWG